MPIDKGIGAFYFLKTVKLKILSHKKQYVKHSFVFHFAIKNQIICVVKKSYLW